MIKHIENFSGDFTFLAFWPSGNVRGRAWTKLAPPLSATDAECDTTEDDQQAELILFIDAC